MRCFRFIQMQVDPPTWVFTWLTSPVRYDQNWQPCTKGPESNSKLGLKSFLSIVSCAPVFIRTGYCVVLLWKQFTRSSGSTSLLLTHTIRLIAAGGKFCWTSPPGTWLAEVWLQAPLAASEGKNIRESHICCTFLTQKWHRSHFTCITWATTDPWLLLGRGLLGSREQKE